MLQEQVSSQRIKEFEAQIAQLDLEEKSWQRRLELALEDLQLTEVDLQRVQQAFERKAARQREVDQAKQRVVAAIRIEVAARQQLDEILPRRSRLEALKAVEGSLLRLARKNVERCTIRSPLSGIVVTGAVQLYFQS